jgi:hypothetical protein
MRKLLHSLVAGFLATTVVVTGYPQPAKAQLTEIAQVIAIANGAVDLVRKLAGGITDDELNDAVDRIIAAVEAAKTEVINHIDEIAAAGVKACSTTHVIEFADVQNFNETTLQTWAQDATACAAEANALLGAVNDQAAADDIGFALNVIVPIAVAARATAGFQTGGLLGLLQNGNQTLMTALRPACVDRYESTWGIVDRTYTCTAYNADVAQAFATRIAGVWRPAPINEGGVQAQATGRTSRAVAVAVLAEIAS